MSKTKIVVLHMKEIIYTLIFVGLGILLILLLVFMFVPKNDAASDDGSPIYNPGVYTSQMSLGNATLNLEVVVDTDHINSIRFVNLDDSVTTMYPLVEPSLKAIAEQLCNDVPLNEVDVSNEDNKYTSLTILETIETTLQKAVPK